ncbi:MAG: S8 family serine peptidase, partial [Bifidobacteriaceae bacterium]|jgi:hypothetical protein|nr:S8 family serine peptidase [Bifidobacteriaceae bacterium]
VAAAGQADGDRNVASDAALMHYPASYPPVLSVAAIRPDGSPMPSGYHNDLVDIAAPGTEVGILIEGGSVGYGAGTSFAAPHAAAAVALLRRHRQDLGPEAIVAAITEAARDITATGNGRDPYTGAGSLDAPQALARIMDTAGPTTRLALSVSAQATVADVPISATVAGWDAVGNPVPDAASATVAYSLGTGCTFPVGTGLSLRTCTVTATFDGVSAKATVDVFDPSALRHLAIVGDAVAGGTLAVTPPAGWPARSVAWQWTAAGTPVPGATSATYTLPADAPSGTLVGVAWTLTHRGLAASGHVDALAVVRGPLSDSSANTPGPDAGSGESPTVIPPGTAPIKATAKVTIVRKGRVVIVRVKAAGVAKPTGTVRVKFGKVTKNATLKAGGKGTVKVRAPKKVRGKVKVTAVYRGSSAVKKGTSATKRMTFT